jgi:hypothetical protein
MAADGYPKISLKAWRTLRAKAASAPTSKFTPDVVATLMDLSSPESALGNTVRPMRRLGLIDEDGALTDRGRKWSVDTSFGDACQEILDEIYPDDLEAMTDEDGHPDTAQVKTWFRLQGFGDSNARLMAGTYVFVASKEIPEPPAADSGRANRSESSPAKSAAAKSTTTREAAQPLATAANEPPSPGRPDKGPTVHLDIQIHIPADATPEQIDQIFSSMARHLYAK